MQFKIRDLVLDVNETAAGECDENITVSPDECVKGGVTYVHQPECEVTSADHGPPPDRTKNRLAEILNDLKVQLTGEIEEAA